MSAGSLGAPGTHAGPCKNECKHKDCAATRHMATTKCHWCKETIGYDHLFYREDDDSFIHASCLEDNLEQWRGKE